jgi:hypothetical protein
MASNETSERDIAVALIHQVLKGKTMYVAEVDFEILRSEVGISFDSDHMNILGHFLCQRWKASVNVM